MKQDDKIHLPDFHRSVIISDFGKTLGGTGDKWRIFNFSSQKLYGHKEIFKAYYFYSPKEAQNDFLPRSECTKT